MKQYEPSGEISSIIKEIISSRHSSINERTHKENSKDVSRRLVFLHKFVVFPLIEKWEGREWWTIILDESPRLRRTNRTDLNPPLVFTRREGQVIDPTRTHLHPYRYWEENRHNDTNQLAQSRFHPPRDEHEVTSHRCHPHTKRDTNFTSPHSLPHTIIRSDIHREPEKDFRTKMIQLIQFFFFSPVLIRWKVKSLSNARMMESMLNSSVVPVSVCNLSQRS